MYSSDGQLSSSHPSRTLRASVESSRGSRENARWNLNCPGRHVTRRVTSCDAFQAVSHWRLVFSYLATRRAGGHFCFARRASRGPAESPPSSQHRRRPRVHRVVPFARSFRFTRLSERASRVRVLVEVSARGRDSAKVRAGNRGNPWRQTRSEHGIPNLRGK